MNEAWKQWEGHVVNGEFHLRQYLGGGEASAVFLTEQGVEKAQKAAIKLVTTDAANAEIQFRSWKLAAELTHPHLIQLLRMGQCRLGDMTPVFLVMEYAEEVLAQVLAQRPLTPPEAQEMLAPVLDVLAYVHGKGFAHGRLNPANIMAVNDQLKVSSDGLCRRGQSSGQPGKPSVYDAPELAHGERSPAGDVWSLGVTLVEALTQRRPVLGSREPEAAILEDNLPAPFGDIARHCLQRDPQRRWTVADIAARLRPDSPVPGEQVLVKQEPPARRRYFLPALALALVLAGIWAGSRLLDRQPEAQQAPLNPVEQPRSRPEPEPKKVKPETKAKRPASGHVPGEVVRQVLPAVPAKARDTIQGTVRVRVRVRVDPSGSVAGARLDSPGPSKYFAGLALQAARGWKFQPARTDGRDVASEWILRFEFARSGTRVFPIRAGP